MNIIVLKVGRLALKDGVFVNRVENFQASVDQLSLQNRPKGLVDVGPEKGQNKADGDAGLSASRGKLLAAADYVGLIVG